MNVTCYVPCSAWWPTAPPGCSFMSWFRLHTCQSNRPASASFIPLPQRLVANCDMGQDAPTDVWDWHIYTNPTGKRIPCGSPGAVLLAPSLLPLLLPPLLLLLEKRLGRPVDADQNMMHAAQSAAAAALVLCT